MTEEPLPFGEVSALTFTPQFHPPVSVECGARQHQQPKDTTKIGIMSVQQEPAGRDVTNTQQILLEVSTLTL